ncbi:hypothetical protein B0H14DRAFT_2627141 [Mycena olivaceomarginata]|nr:hypothetical protein B0H14DRAFT_2627141 [Mycena olivaceomarginata]
MQSFLAKFRPSCSSFYSVAALMYSIGLGGLYEDLNVPRGGTTLYLPFYPECGDSGHELEQRCETSEAGECKVGHNRGVGSIEGLKVAEGDMGKFCIQMQHTQALAQYLQEDFDILECFESNCLNLHPRKQHVEAAVRNVSLTLWRMEKSLSPALTSAGEDRAISRRQSW